VTPARVAALASLGWLIANQGELARAKELFREYLPLVRELGDARLLGEGFDNLALIAVDQGELRSRASLL
jgi:hypothetical protein